MYDTMYFSSALQNASLYIWIVKGLKDPIMQDDIVKYILSLWSIDCEVIFNGTMKMHYRMLVDALQNACVRFIH